MAIPNIFKAKEYLISLTSTCCTIACWNFRGSTPSTSFVACTHYYYSIQIKWNNRSYLWSACPPFKEDLPSPSPPNINFRDECLNCCIVSSWVTLYSTSFFNKYNYLVKIFLSYLLWHLAPKPAPKTFIKNWSQNELLYRVSCPIL